MSCSPLWIAVGIPLGAADLRATVHKKVTKVAASFSPLRAAMLDVGKPWIEEDGGGIARFAADNGDTGFCWDMPAHRTEEA